MFEKLKSSWNTLMDSCPGERFIDRYNRKKDNKEPVWQKVLMVSGGSVCTAVGIIFLATPGPGIVVLFIGLGMIGQESSHMAHGLDWSEVKIRAVIKWGEKAWNGYSIWVKILLIIIAVAVTALVCYGLYVFFLSS